MSELKKYTVIYRDGSVKEYKCEKCKKLGNRYVFMNGGSVILSAKFVDIKKVVSGSVIGVDLSPLAPVTYYMMTSHSVAKRRY